MLHKYVLAAALLALILPPSGALPRQAPSRPNVRTLTLESAVFGNSRAIRVYLPPGYSAASDDARRYPVLYLNDGYAVFAAKAWDAPTQLDRLISEHRVRPLILVGIDNAASIDGAKTPILDRAAEYLPYPDPSEPDVPAPRGSLYPRFLFDEVMPLVEREVRVDRNDVSLGGASYGGIAAVYAAFHAPRKIARLVLESTPLFLFDERLTKEAEHKSWPAVVYAGIGTRETDDAEILGKGAAALDRFLDAATRAGVRTRLNRVTGAEHNSAAWKARFPTALEWLFADHGSAGPQSGRRADGRSASRRRKS